MVSRIYTIGLYNWSRTRNESKVFFNIQTYKDKALSTKRVCIRKSKIKINQTIIIISRIPNTIRTKEK